MDIGQQLHSQLLLELGQHLKALLHAGTAETAA